MEPKLPSFNRGPEHLPTPLSQGAEHVPSMPSPEKILERKREQFEGRPENDSHNVASPPPVLPQVQVTAPVDGSTIANPPTDDTPLVAADDDLIEKEWVDKAKEIVARTKDDPYQREREVGKLQIDYQRKRYGKEIGAS